MKGDYEEFNALRRRKNKANSKPIHDGSAFRVQSSAVKAKRSCLKKQTQFSKEQIGVSIYRKGEYEEYQALKTAKNKAKQSQTSLSLRPKPSPSLRDEAATRSKS